MTEANWIAFGVSFTVSVVVPLAVAFIAYVYGPRYVNGIVDKARDESAKELEALKSDLRRFEVEAATRYNWLHEKRAEAIVEVHAALYELEVALSHYLNLHFERTEEQAKVKVEQLRDTLTAHGRFCRAYYLSSIYFNDSSIIEKCDKIHRRVNYKVRRARAYDFEVNSDTLDAMIENADLGEIESEERALRELLRKELGANDKWSIGA